MQIQIAYLVSLAVLFSLSGQPAFAADSYVCVAEQSTGFAFNKARKKWQSTDFDVAAEKFLLSKIGNEWKWSKFGHRNSPSLSKCTPPNDAGYIICRGLYDIRINTKSLRFQSIYAVGYFNEPIFKQSEGADTPNITIGTCATP